MSRLRAVGKNSKKNLHRRNTIIYPQRLAVMANQKLVSVNPGGLI
jgi:hypothetical protein